MGVGVVVKAIVAVMAVKVVEAAKARVVGSRVMRPGLACML